MTASSRRDNYMTTAIERIVALALSCDVHVDVEPLTQFCARLRFADGRVHMLIGADLGLNSSSARRVADDKAFCAHFLALDGLSMVTSRVIGPDDALPNDVAFPVVIKPNRGFGGDGVVAVTDGLRLADAVVHARRFDSIVLIQPLRTEPEFRLIVVGDSCVAAYRRVRLEVIGDGRTTLGQLLAKHNSAAIGCGSNIGFELSCQGLSLEDVPDDGARVRPLIAANLKRGGSWRECPELNDRYRSIATAAAKSLGLVVAGVDLFVIKAMDADGDYAILEVNANPGFEYLRMQPAILDRMIELVWSRIEAGT